MMTKQFLFSLAFAFLLFSCKKESTPSTSSSTNEKQTEKPRTECYTYDANGSAVTIELQFQGNNVTGTLNYSLAEKDSNTGTIKGKVENNILIADYTFYSEGTESVRQVAFQIGDNKLVEGYGEMTKEGTQFKDVTKLSFDSKMPLTKMDCTE